MTREINPHTIVQYLRERKEGDDLISEEDRERLDMGCVLVYVPMISSPPEAPSRRKRPPEN